MVFLGLKKKVLTRICTAAYVFAFLTIASITGAADTISGKVVSIADGDTLTVLDDARSERKVRLNGIDAPELGQAFGQVSKRNLGALVFGKLVRVEWRKIDRYGRLVGSVYVGETDANLEQLRAGMAWYFVKYESDVPAANRKPYAEAERDARTARRGLWADAKPVAPWDFRHPEQPDALGGAASSRQSPPAQPGGNQSSASRSAPGAAGRIIGNRNSGIYHAPTCPDYDRVSERNREYFDTEADAVKAGYRKARNCP